MKKLTAREELFCRMYAYCRNGREAAVKSGYTVCPEINSRKLLASRLVRETIERYSQEMNITLSEVKAGLRRIAFSSSADAVKLILCPDGQEIDPEKLDLFNVAEIKRPKGGGIEIKFFDRIKALEKLGDITESDTAENAACASFYEALEKSAMKQGDNG
jgi:hypothetical protein